MVSKITLRLLDLFKENVYTYLKFMFADIYHN